MRRVAHWPELDGLRALAVIAVILFHSDDAGPVSGGFHGVDLFFVLSAFLITTILRDEWQTRGSINLAKFYWRRFLRLMPALLLMLAAYVAVAPFIWPSYPHARDALITAAYLSDYGYSFWRVPNILRHSWSLAVEEHFYLLWPLALPFLLRCRNPILWLVMAYASAILWRAQFGEWQDYYYRFDTRATGLIFGAVLACFRDGRSVKQWLRQPWAP